MQCHYDATKLGVRTKGPYTIERAHVNGNLTIQLRDGAKVLTYAVFCRIIKVLPLTPMKTVLMEELCMEVFSSFLPHAIFLHLFIGGNECGVVSTAVLIV